MAVAVSSRPRVSVDGKFFRLGEKKFYVKGVAYGPFAPNAAGPPFASPEQTAADFAQIAGTRRQPGARLPRPAALVSRPGRTARAQGARRHPVEQAPVFPGLRTRRAEAREAVRRAVAGVRAASGGLRLQRGQRNPAGHRALERRRGAWPISSMNWSTKPNASIPNASARSPIIRRRSFCARRALDFVCFNVYLHQRQPFKNYLARLQMMAEAKPLAAGRIRH